MKLQDNLQKTTYLRDSQDNASDRVLSVSQPHAPLAEQTLFYFDSRNLMLFPDLFLDEVCNNELLEPHRALYQEVRLASSICLSQPSNARSMRSKRRRMKARASSCVWI